jgi:hypothetical protein
VLQIKISSCKDYLQKPKRREKTESFIRWDGIVQEHQAGTSSMWQCLAIALFINALARAATPCTSWSKFPNASSVVVVSASVLQRAHHGMHTIKIITVYGPNSITSSVFEPASGREHDDYVLLTWSFFDAIIERVLKIGDLIILAMLIPSSRVHNTALEPGTGPHLGFR